METTNNVDVEKPADRDDDVADENNLEVESGGKALTYTLTQNPPIPILIGVAFQHILMNLAFGLMAAFIVADVICASYDSPVRTTLFSSTLFMSGVCTLLQTGLGIRLPVYQGPSASFFPALMALNNNPEWECVNHNRTVQDYQDLSNTTSIIPLTEVQRLQQLSGSLMVASLFEILIGATGLIGFLLRYIGPVTIGPTIALIGLSLYKIPIGQSRPSPEIGFGGLVLTIFFVLYIPHVGVPLPKLRKKDKRSYFKIFQLLPVILSIMVMWGISAILTTTDVFPNDPSVLRYKARTDAKSSLLHNTPWFTFPYPGQFGVPSFSLAAFVGFMTGFCASMVESVGDYFAVARACQVDPPPDHAVSRGILMEGLAGLLGGAVGTGHATTSYSGNISAIIMTKTASRSVLLCCGVQLLVLAVLGKFGATIATIPDPALVGVIVVLCGMLISLGIAALRHVNMDSSRNVAIVGVALFLGTFLPEWVQRYPDLIQTGVSELDGVLKVALGTPMFVGGVFALVLDNTVRGTKKERGLLTFRQSSPLSTKGDHSATADGEKGDNYKQTSGTTIYEWSCVQRLYQSCKYLHILPFLPPKMTVYERSNLEEGDAML